MSNDNTKTTNLKRSRRLFEAFLTRDKVEAGLSPGAPTQVAYRTALEFLTHDSDHHIAELEQHGPQYCDNVIRGTLLAMEYWAHQITIMTLTVERARLLARLAEGPSENEPLN